MYPSRRLRCDHSAIALHAAALTTSAMFPSLLLEIHGLKSDRVECLRIGLATAVLALDWRYSE